MIKYILLLLTICTFNLNAQTTKIIKLNEQDTKLLQMSEISPEITKNNLNKEYHSFTGTDSECTPSEDFLYLICNDNVFPLIGEKIRNAYITWQYSLKGKENTLKEIIHEYLDYQIYGYGIDVWKRKESFKEYKVTVSKDNKYLILEK
jgi:hypothetical protein